jgi:hypothetical protein
VGWRILTVKRKAEGETSGGGSKKEIMTLVQPEKRITSPIL